ncbi:Modification methylase BspRI [uncultured Leptotrichia sp.]|uniref:DNA cytosine methyltransferase n=1 Tax=uncultured Leptotrichia sp. TaxID=159271 RepID=UPI001A57C878|nr:DNA (cytosine-5-)-methyltransferase [uncultured Leptotrichia sp.]VTX50293.1 Modification methylase BspRI [uncultured Leptotrichia sp.]
MNTNKKVLSLFSGCGGMDIGIEGGFKCIRRMVNEYEHSEWIEEIQGNLVTLKETGFKTIFANDIRPDAKSAWVSYFSKRINNANDIYKLGSIVDLVKRHKGGEQIFPSEVDVVTGGFPCQDFSVAGKRKGLKSNKSHDNKLISDIEKPTIENRGELYIWMREVINIVKPKLFIAENVKGLVSLENIKEIIEEDFSKAAKNGYLVVPGKVLQAANYGVPQSRERIIFFGFRKDALTKKAIKELENFSEDSIYNPYPKPTHSYSVVGENLYSFVKSREVLRDLKEPNLSKDLSQTKYSKAKYLPKGQGNIEIDLNSVSPTIRSEHHGNIEFRRLSLENGGKNIDELNKGMEQRRLTVRECARLQTFPDDYKFILNKTEQNVALSASNAYKIIGNAVPCILAYNIIQLIKDKWNLYFKN